MSKSLIIKSVKDLDDINVMFGHKIEGWHYIQGASYDSVKYIEVSIELNEIINKETLEEHIDEKFIVCFESDMGYIKLSEVLYTKYKNNKTIARIAGVKKYFGDVIVCNQKFSIWTFIDIYPMIKNCKTDSDLHETIELISSGILL